MTDFIGTGWAYPPRVDADGRVCLVEGMDEIEAALRAILSTAPGERLMRPDFGCAAWDHVFDPVNANTIGLVEQAVDDAVRRWEPRVEVLDVVVSVEPIGLLVDLAYRIKATNDRRNLVYPFYVIVAEGAT